MIEPRGSHKSRTYSLGARERVEPGEMAPIRCSSGELDERPHAVWVHPPTSGPVALAGVFAINKDDGVPSFAVVVDRGFPVVSDVDAWLDPKTSDPRGLLAEATEWKTAPVGNRAQRELF